MSEEYVTVSALTKYIKYKFDKDPHLGRVYLTGKFQIFVYVRLTNILI